MKVIIGDQARKAGIARTGRDPGREIHLDFASCSDAEKAAVALATNFNRDGDIAVCASGAADITLEAVVAELVRSANAKTEQAAKEKAEKEGREQAAQEHAAWALTLPQWEGDYPHPEGYYSSHYSDYKAVYDLVPGVAERRRVEEERRIAESKERDRVANENRAKVEADRKAKRVEAENTLRMWAIQHGSERVKMLIEENHESWVSIAEDEFLSAHIPEGFMPKNVIEKDRTKPEVADILALREARKLTEQDIYLSDPQMLWIIEYREADEDDDPEDIDGDGDIVMNKCGAIRLTISAPTGKTWDVYRLLG